MTTLKCRCGALAEETRHGVKCDKCRHYEPAERPSAMKWTKIIHPAFLEFKEAKKSNLLLAKALSGLVGKWQYKADFGKKRYSIIMPSKATFGLWEAYNGNNTPRFQTLKEAKEWCENDCKTD